jgi:hypothetical protein
MARSDDRRRDREDTERGLRDLENADWDETSEVVANAAAQAAAKTAARLSRPDEDAPESVADRPPWHRTRAAKTGGIVTAIVTAIGSVLALLQQLGVLK